MKKLTSLISAAAILVPVAVSAASFEGRVVMKVTDAHGSVVPMTISLKSPLTRMDFETPQGAAGMIMDQSKQQVTILMPEQKMYMVQPIPASAAEPATKGGELAPEKTNEHEKIAGYDTTKYVLKGKNSTTEIWVTDQLGTFLGLGTNAMSGFGARRGGRSNAANAGWEKAFEGKDAFPLRVIETGTNGKQSSRMEATSVEKKSIPDSAFAPPADYQMLDMGAMMQGRGMPGGMPGSARVPREK